MIQRIIEFSANNRWIVLILVGVAVLLAVRSVQSIPLDAIPDLSDTQVIVYSQWDRSPDIVEDQVTYPIISSLLGVPGVKTDRGFSDFGFSYVYVIFEDGTDIYWARSRVLEYLSKILPRLPRVRTSWAPTPPAWAGVFRSALVDWGGSARLPSCALQDWYLRTGWPASPGWPRWPPSGFQKQYQVQLDPAPAGARVSLDQVLTAVRRGTRTWAGAWWSSRAPST